MTLADTTAEKGSSLKDDNAEHRQKPGNMFLPSMLFLAFTLIFACLRSRDIFGVDGAFRCLEVYWRQSIFFHDNNHLLYPVNVLAWSRLLRVLGFTADTRQGFYSLVEMLNCFAAAASLAIVFCLTKLATGSPRLAFCVSAGLGFSKAFLLHATNSAEPMVAVFWSFLAVCLAALSFKTERKWPIIASGFLFVLAMATYRSTIFLAPAAIVIIWAGQARGHSQSFFHRAQVAVLCQFALGALVGCLSIYGWVFSRLGITRPNEMLRRFFAQEDTRVYLGAGTGKVLNLPLGLVRNIFPVQSNFTGIRNLLAGPPLSTGLFLLLVAAVCASLVIYAAQVFQKWNRIPAFAQTSFIAAGAGFLFSIIPLALWSPHYDKLWLQPLACLAVLLGISISVMVSERKTVLSSVLPALLLCGVLSNVIWALRSHSTETSDLSETERLSHIVDTNDLLVGEWDRLTTLYGYGWAEAPVFSFPSEAVVHGPDSVKLLQERVTKTHKAGGKIYFLALLDLPQTAWDSFLGSRCGVPYSEMDFYRAHSTVRVAKFRNGPESVIELRRLDLPK